MKLSKGNLLIQTYSAFTASGAGIQTGLMSESVSFIFYLLHVTPPFELSVIKF